MRQLNESARAIDRRSNLRVLFHGAWIEPVGGIESADPILITGGRKFGQHNELEGYVVLTSERYLRLQANLWMTRFSTGNALDSDTPVLPIPVVTVQPAASSDLEADDSGTRVTVYNTPVTDYIPDQIYQMDQERRMRVGELHYLDHPRFGMIVQVTPYEAPQQATPATTETPPDSQPISTAPDATATGAEQSPAR